VRTASPTSDPSSYSFVASASSPSSRTPSSCARAKIASISETSSVDLRPDLQPLFPVNITYVIGHGSHLLLACSVHSRCSQPASSFHPQYMRHKIKVWGERLNVRRGGIYIEAGNFATLLPAASIAVLISSRLEAGLHVWESGSIKIRPHYGKRSIARSGPAFDNRGVVQLIVARFAPPERGVPD
jgi:hypothetical protein